MTGGPVSGGMIDGVIISPLKQIRDERGAVLHMLRADAPHYKGFGEVYFSQVNPGAAKAWKRHTEMTLNIAVPIGRVLFALYDARPGSATEGELQTVILGEDNYALLTVPPGIWSGFMALGTEGAMLANCADIVYRDDEVERLPFDTPDIPMDWESFRA